MFSIVIPLYNKARYIKRALDSVLNQSIGDYEVIVVDDGSTDGGPLLVTKHNDSRIRLIRQKNSGVSAARNRGIEESRGHWIAFLDADDAWKRNYLRTIVNLIKKFPQAGAYATAYEIVLPMGTVILPKYEAIRPFPWEGLIPSYFRAALGTPPLTASSITIPKAIFSKVGTFSVGVPLGEDLDMWGRIALKYPIAFSNVICTSYFQDIRQPGRRKHYYFTKMEPVFVKSAKEAMRRGDVRKKDLEELNEYMNKLEIAVGYDCLIDGKNSVIARKIIVKTNPKSVSLKLRKYRTLLQTYLPDNFIQFIIRIKHLLYRLK